MAKMQTPTLRAVKHHVLNVHPRARWIALLDLLVRFLSVLPHIQDQKMKCREAKQLGDVPVCLPLNFQRVLSDSCEDWFIDRVACGVPLACGTLFVKRI